MTLSASTIWEVQPSVGSDNSGGGFNVGNANFATDLAATSATGGSPVVTSASYTFVAGDVGAILFVAAGTNWIPGFYPIASVGAGAATLTASIGGAELYGGASLLNTSAGCAATASPTGGTWGIDYSRTASARFAFTDLVIDATTNTKFTSAANPAGKHMVGNILKVTSGAGFTVQRVEVASVSGTTATCDKSLGTLSSTGGNGNLGGCLATIGGSSNGVASNKIFVKATATITATATATNNLSFTGAAPSNSAPPTRLTGYSSYRGDGGRVSIALSTNTGLSGLVAGCIGAIVANFDVNCSGLGTSIGINLTASDTTALNCKVSNFTNYGIKTAAGSQAVFGCEVTGGTSAATAAIGGNTGTTLVQNSNVHDNACTGLLLSANFSKVLFNRIVNNSGSSSDGVAFAAAGGMLSGVILSNTIDSNGRHGISGVSGAYSFPLVIRNNLITNHTAGGAAGLMLDGSAGAPAIGLYDGNFYYNNTSNRVNSDGLGVTNPQNGVAPHVNSNDVILSANPYTVAGSVYTLNSVTGGGAAARGAGTPGALTGATGTGYPDGGCYQHQDAPFPLPAPPRRMVFRQVHTRIAPRLIPAPPVQVLIPSRPRDRWKVLASVRRVPRYAQGPPILIPLPPRRVVSTRASVRLRRLLIPGKATTVPLPSPPRRQLPRQTVARLTPPRLLPGPATTVPLPARMRCRDVPRHVVRRLRSALPGPPVQTLIPSRPRDRWKVLASVRRIARYAPGPPIPIPLPPRRVVSARSTVRPLRALVPGPTTTAPLPMAPKRLVTKVSTPRVIPPRLLPGPHTYEPLPMRGRDRWGWHQSVRRQAPLLIPGPATTAPLPLPPRRVMIRVVSPRTSAPRIVPGPSSFVPIAPRPPRLIVRQVGRRVVAPLPVYQPIPLMVRGRDRVTLKQVVRPVRALIPGPRTTVPVPLPPRRVVSRSTWSRPMPRYVPGNPSSVPVAGPARRVAYRSVSFRSTPPRLVPGPATTVPLPLPVRRIVSRVETCRRLTKPLPGPVVQTPLPTAARRIVIRTVQPQIRPARLLPGPPTPIAVKTPLRLVVQKVPQVRRISALIPGPATTVPLPSRVRQRISVSASVRRVSACIQPPPVINQVPIATPPRRVSFAPRQSIRRLFPALPGPVVQTPLPSAAKRVVIRTISPTAKAPRLLPRPSVPIPIKAPIRQVTRQVPQVRRISALIPGPATTVPLPMRGRDRTSVRSSVRRVASFVPGPRTPVPVCLPPRRVPFAPVVSTRPRVCAAIFPPPNVTPILVTTHRVVR